MTRKQLERFTQHAIQDIARDIHFLSQQLQTIEHMQDKPRIEAIRKKYKIANVCEDAT